MILNLPTKKDDSRSCALSYVLGLPATVIHQSAVEMALGAIHWSFDIDCVTHITQIMHALETRSRGRKSS